MRDESERGEAGQGNPGQGKLQLHTEPWTIVFIDGQMAGATPVFREEIEEGRHRLRMLNDEFGIDATEEVTLVAGERKTVFRRFHGTLEIRLPEGTETHVNGQCIQTDAASSVTREMPCGYHQVRRVCLGTREETVFNVLVKSGDRVVVR